MLIKFISMYIFVVKVLLICCLCLILNYKCGNVFVENYDFCIRNVNLLFELLIDILNFYCLNR